MVVSLSDFFRIVLSKGKDVITLKEEEQHIRSYLEIQQVRYRDILDYDIQIPQELYQYKISKLTLQPLVENSLYHGIKNKRGKGTIYVTGRLEGEKIYLDVKDTGVGMNEAELASLRSKITRPCKETDSGFGLANVNERLRMKYGPEYGMTIHSILGEGTWVQVVIPALSIYEEEPIKEKIAEGE
jgi:two-component system sensor histidine kinase YesM